MHAQARLFEASAAGHQVFFRGAAEGGVGRNVPRKVTGSADEERINQQRAMGDEPDGTKRESSISSGSSARRGRSAETVTKLGSA